MSGWSKGALSLMTLLMLGGCASTALKEEVRRKDAKLKAVNGEIGLLRDKHEQIARDNDALRQKQQSVQRELDALQKADSRAAQALAAKDHELALMKKQVASGGAAKPASRGAGKAPSGFSAGVSKGRYHLRIISLPQNNPHSQKVVQQIAGYLQSRGIKDVVPRQSGKFWVVDIGHFSSIRSADAEELKKSVRSMRYKGIRQFKDAIYVPY